MTARGRNEWKTRKREREKEKKGETKEGKEKEGFSTLARIYRSTFEDSGCGMKNRCIHDGLVDHRGSMEPCRNQADAVHHDPSIHPSIDRSHECAHTSRLGGGVRFRFFFRPRWERFIIVEPGEIYCLSWEIDSCFVVYRAIVSSIMGWIERVEKVWESCSGFRILDWRRYLEIFFVLENLILKSNEPIPSIH